MDYGRIIPWWINLSVELLFHQVETGAVCGWQMVKEDILIFFFQKRILGLAFHSPTNDVLKMPVSKK